MIRNLKTGQVLAEHVEVFDNVSNRTRGLTKFDQAPDRYAALFILPFGGFLPAITTRGMKFPIHVAWCDRQGRILDAAFDCKPNRWMIFPKFPVSLCGARYLIEFPTEKNAATKENLEVGSALRWGAQA